MAGLLAVLWVFPVGAVAGLAGAVAMDLPMSRQPEGWTPAVVATSVLGRRRPEQTDFRVVASVHHGAGVLAGLLYALLLVPFLVLLPRPAVGGVPLVGHAAAVTAVVAFIYGFFAHLVLPRVMGDVPEHRATAIRGQWLRSVVVFGLVLAAGVPLLAAAG